MSESRLRRDSVATDRADYPEHHESENGHGSEGVENGNGKYDIRHGFSPQKT